MCLLVTAGVMVVAIQAFYVILLFVSFLSRCHCKGSKASDIELKLKGGVCVRFSILLGRKEALWGRTGGSQSARSSRPLTPPPMGTFGSSDGWDGIDNFSPQYHAFLLAGIPGDPSVPSMCDL